MDRQYNIVIISVSPLLTKAFQSVMERKGLNYPIYEANTEKAEGIIRNFQRLPEPHVFITRGRTYSYLRERTDAALVNVPFSYFSYASLIKRFHNLGIRKIAIMGYSDQFRHNSERFNHILDEGIRFFTYNWRNYSNETLALHMQEELLRLKEEGYEGFIGGSLVYRLATKLGLHCAENFPDEDLVETSLEEAAQICETILTQEEKNETVSAFVRTVPEILLKISETGIITDYNLAAEKAFHAENLHKNILEFLPELNQESLSKRTAAERNLLLSHGSRKLIADIAPIIVSGEYRGSIITARYVDEIQKLEQNIRSKLAERGLTAKATFNDILGTSHALKQTIRWAKKIAAAEGTVLLIGDTGTGKELFAQSIHNFSSRSSAPFVAINCAALSPSVLESELFGYVKGAFTGARTEGKTGIFELAHKGTIFLDEIGELPLELQAKLLRVLQEKEVVRLGDTRVIPVDVRVIAATNRNLEEEVAKGHFRPDLFYRLNVLTLRIPTLEERRSDIPLLATRFLEKQTDSHQFTEEALLFLEHSHWPGNVRQLRNCVERAAVFADQELITGENMRELFSFTAKNTDPRNQNTVKADPDSTDMAGGFLRESERIVQALSAVSWNRARAAKALGISTVTLWRKMKKYGIQKE